MSRTLMAFSIVMALALAVTACGKKTPSQKAGDAERPAGQAAADAAKAAGDAVGDAANATGKAAGDAIKATEDLLTESRDSSVKAARETLDGIEKKWQELQAKAAPTTDEAKADFQKAKDQMSQALAEAKAKLVEAKDASGDVWQKDVKPALDAAVQKAGKLYEDVAAKFGGN